MRMLLQKIAQIFTDKPIEFSNNSIRIKAFRNKNLKASNKIVVVDKEGLSLLIISTTACGNECAKFLAEWFGIEHNEKAVKRLGEWLELSEKELVLGWKDKVGKSERIVVMEVNPKLASEFGWLTNPERERGSKEEIKGEVLRFIDKLFKGELKYAIEREIPLSTVVIGE